MNAAISIMNNRLPDSVADLFALQKKIIRELKLQNEIYFAVDGELDFLKKQNSLLKIQIENVCNLVDRLDNDRHLDAGAGTIGIA
jgi:hypothetical protein